MDRAVNELPAYLQPSGVLVVTTLFSVVNGELTTNLKLRRQFIASKYGDRLNRLREAAERAHRANGPERPALTVHMAE